MPNKRPKPWLKRFTNVWLVKDDKIVRDDLWVENGKIVNASSRFWKASCDADFSADEIIDGGGGILAPGFIDLQLNGGFGIDFSNPGVTSEGIQEVAMKVLQYGVTSFLPTLVSSRPEVYRQVLPLLQPRRGSSSLGASILGVHLEGPFMCRNRKGAHDEGAICSSIDRGLDSLVDVYGPALLEPGLVRLVTIAPELDGADLAIRVLSERGIVVSLGHSSSGIVHGVAGVRAGARMITHLFNAMEPFHHRNPGLVGLISAAAVAASPRDIESESVKLSCLSVAQRPSYGIIADGVHVHPASVAVAYNAHPSGCILVSDAMAAMGLPVGRHRLGTVEVNVVAGLADLNDDSMASEFGSDADCPRAYVTGTTILAGSVLPIDSCVRNLIRFTGCTAADAIATATRNPARLLFSSNGQSGSGAGELLPDLSGIKGELSDGADADLVLLDRHTLAVLATYVGGEKVWERPLPSTNLEVCKPVLTL